MTRKTLPAIKIVQRPIGQLTPFARNSRTHSPEQIDQIAASIEEFGWTNPILVDGKNGIIAGHGRLAAAEKLGLAKLPVIVIDHLTDDQKRALVIADNKLALNAGWDMDLLGQELAALGESGFDLSLIGFDEDALAELLADKTDGLTDPDAVPEAPADPVTQLGDVWILGKHRIVCGDSTDPDAVTKALAGIEPHLMVTDPPYGVEYDPTWRKEAGVNKNDGKMGKVLNDDRADWREAWALFPGDVAYVWHASLFTREVLDSLESCGFRHRSMIIWNKDRFTLGRGDYHWQHEPCWYVVRKNRKGHFSGGRSQSTVWNIPARDDSGVGHGTQKPVECMQRPIENNSSPGQAVYEPFSGSGTTIIAGEISGRPVHAIELNPAYVDVAIVRWQEFTGEEAVHEDGRKFNAVKPVKKAA